jgi:molybdenum cofactor cytidylyltransferase
LAGLGFEIVANAAPERGMGHSLALGARRAAARDVDAALLCLGDMPFITAGHLAALLAAFEGEAVPLVATENAGTGVRSPPILFGRRHFPLFAALDGDQGGRGLLHEAFIVKASEAILRDIDIAGDLR